MTDTRTLREIRDDFLAFAKSCSPKCEVFASLSTYGGPGVVTAQFYPSGMIGHTSFHFEADDWIDLKAQMVAKWAEHSDTHATNLIRNMALQIISITADQGECTDAALRGAKFEAADVAFYGERACAEAERIASCGPFSIVTTSGANARAA